MAKQRGKIGKYSKINLQKKFQLLKLTQWNHSNLKEISKHLNINFSTAKTIFFQFQKEKAREKLKFFEKQSIEKKEKQTKFQSKKFATYKTSSVQACDSNKIQIICSQSRCKNNKVQFEQFSQLVQNEGKIQGSIHSSNQKEVITNEKTVNMNVSAEDFSDLKSNNPNQVYNFMELSTFPYQVQLSPICYNNNSFQNATINIDQCHYFINFIGTSMALPYFHTVPQ